mmetsp:Transcript_22503/g.32862  ORF Transcript_22503/g.32862 Transcript_22503/m.32862 type:complete len:719 (-) Transcript_22503:668-2824(-)
MSDKTNSNEELTHPLITKFRVLQSFISADIEIEDLPQLREAAPVVFVELHNYLCHGSDQWHIDTQKVSDPVLYLNIAIKFLCEMCGRSDDLALVSSQSVVNGDYMAIEQLVEAYTGAFLEEMRLLRQRVDYLQHRLCRKECSDISPGKKNGRLNRSENRPSSAPTRRLILSQGKHTKSHQFNVLLKSSRQRSKSPSKDNKPKLSATNAYIAPKPCKLRSFQPLLPLDLVISVKHCSECAHHEYIRHDETEFISRADSVLRYLSRAVHKLGLCVRCGVIRHTADGREAVGAFEVQVTLRDDRQNLYAEVLHSRLSTGRWPVRGILISRLHRLLNSLNLPHYQATASGLYVEQSRPEMATCGQQLEDYPCTPCSWASVALSSKTWSYSRPSLMGGSEGVSVVPDYVRWAFDTKIELVGRVCGTSTCRALTPAQYSKYVNAPITSRYACRGVAIDFDKDEDVGSTIADKNYATVGCSLCHKSFSIPSFKRHACLCGKNRLEEKKVVNVFDSKIQRVSEEMVAASSALASSNGHECYSRSSNFQSSRGFRQAIRASRCLYYKLKPGSELGDERIEIHVNHIEYHDESRVYCSKMLYVKLQIESLWNADTNAVVRSDKDSFWLWNDALSMTLTQLEILRAKHLDIFVYDADNKSKLICKAAVPTIEIMKLVKSCSFGPELAKSFSFETNRYFIVDNTGDYRKEKEAFAGRIVVNLYCTRKESV